MKICNKCKEPKNADEFYKAKYRKGGVDIYCKDCRKEMNAKNEQRQTTKEYRKKYKAQDSRLKEKCHWAVCRALKEGDLSRQPCEVCGDTEVDAHHDDYDKPLDVRWLCRKHHNEHHRIMSGRI